MATALVSTGPYLKNTKAITGNTALGNPTAGQTFVAAQGMSTGKVVVERIGIAGVTDTVHNSMSFYIYDGSNAIPFPVPTEIPEWTTRYTAFPMIKPFVGGVPLPGGQIDLPDNTWMVIATVYTTVPDGIQIEAAGKIYA